MNSPQKKFRKKGGAGGDAEEAFDYGVLIPKTLDAASKRMVERFLRNEAMNEDERDQALVIFAQALMAEHHTGETTSKAGQTATTATVMETDSSAASNTTTVITNDVSNQQNQLARQSLKSPSKTSPRQSKSPRHSADQEHASPVAQSSDDVASSSSARATAAPFEPNADSFTEERQRINVGWMAGPSDAHADYDRKIAVYSQQLGCQMYNFISYPIGGSKRGFWTPTAGEVPPPINLPDLQLQNHLWETYVNAQVSEWIDCDSDDADFAKLSREELLKELNYTAYMGLRSAVIVLRRADSPNLAKLLNEWFWTRNVLVAIWVFVPTSTEDMIRKEDDQRDIWEIWADFRTACSNYSSTKLIAGLHITTNIDDEFLDKHLLARWKAEPLATFLIGHDVFGTDARTSKATLSSVHCSLLQELWSSDNARIVVRGPRDSVLPARRLLEFTLALRETVRDVTKRQKGITDTGFLADGSVDYMDVLQAPLQPLADNLDSSIYNTFEQDPIKYKRYREAVEKALYDIGETAERPQSAVLYVLGAGRGPLVTASLEAEHAYNERYRSRRDRLKLTVVVVEKNANAIVTLRYMNDVLWKQRCRIIESDMRNVPAVAEALGLPKPDLIVSELLGSFGDNELSPECLDGITPFLKPTTISIPQSYTSYAAPIMSLHMHQVVRSTGPSYWNSGIPGHGRQGSSQLPDGTYEQQYPQTHQVASLDQIYVVYLRQFCPLAETKPIFTFDHPNFESKSNERSIVVEYDIDRNADVMGFAGYFHMTLYKDVVLSIVPSTYSKGMISWFPALIPLRKLHRVRVGDKVAFVMDRKCDAQGVWYEWKMRQTSANGAVTETPMQNVNGDSYYMKLG